MICDVCNEDKNIKHFIEGKKLFLDCAWCRNLKDLDNCDKEIRIIITKKDIVIERKI